MIDPRLEDALDRWAARAFEGDDGGARLRPWLARWDAEVGALRPDDPDFEAWASARVDWALVDHGAGARVLDALAELDPHVRAVARSWVGLFEVWPTHGARAAWLRDRVGGAALPLGVTIDLRPEPEGPAALWELRGVVRDGALVPCRAPIAYPLAALPAFAEPVVPDPARPGALWPALRRARLWHGRAPRIDPRPRFAEALAGAVAGPDPLR